MAGRLGPLAPRMRRPPFRSFVHFALLTGERKHREARQPAP
jgi:hypothetical protein